MKYVVVGLCFLSASVLGFIGEEIIRPLNEVLYIMHLFATFGCIISGVTFMCDDGLIRRIHELGQKNDPEL